MIPKDARIDHEGARICGQDPKGYVVLRFEFRVERRGGTRRSPTKKLTLLKEMKEYHDDAFDELISECKK